MPLLSFSLSRELDGKHQPQSQADAPKRRSVEAPKSNTTVPRVAEPTPTAIHAVSPRTRTRGIRLGRGRIIPVPIRAPLPNVAAHVVQTQLVRPFPAHGMCFLTRIIPIPSYFTYIIAPAVLVSPASIPAPGSVVPLCLRRQTKR